MNHQEAVTAQAVERYLLKELSPSETEAFELHYFDCPHCAQAIEAGSQFLENTKAVFAQDATAPSRQAERSVARPPFWSKWLAGWRQPAFGYAASLAVVAGSLAMYQGMVLVPNAQRLAVAAQPAAALTLMAASRGQVTETVVPPGASTLVLSVVLPPDVHSRYYHWKLTLGDQLLSEATIPAPETGQPLLIAAPLRGLRTTEYLVSIYSMSDSVHIGDKIDVYPFRLRFP